MDSNHRTHKRTGLQPVAIATMRHLQKPDYFHKPSGKKPYYEKNYQKKIVK